MFYLLMLLIMHLGLDQQCEGARKSFKLRSLTPLDHRPLTDIELKDFTNVVCNFTGRYFSEVMTTQGDQSVFVSPLAVLFSYVPFALYSSGTTQQEIYNVFGINRRTIEHIIPKVFKLFNITNTNTEEEDTVQLKLVTAFYVSKFYRTTQDFNDTLFQLFGSRPQKINFRYRDEASAIINEEIANRTYQLVENISNPAMFLKEPTMVSFSSMIFKAQWFLPFPTYRSYKSVFQSSLGDKTIMFLRDTPNLSLEYAEDDELKCKILIKRYINYQDYGCMFFLPNYKRDIKYLLADLSVAKVLTQKLEQVYTYYYVNLTLPFIEMKNTWNVTGLLSKMGIKELYTENAQFREVLNVIDGDFADHHVRFSGTYQSIRFDINETGSDAAATFRHFHLSRRLLTDYKEFNASHPFAFVVFLKKIPLYIGVFDG